MKRLLLAGLLPAFLCLLSGCGQDDRPRMTAIVGATILDAQNHAILPDSIVIVEGSRILAAGKQSMTPLPKGSEIIDGKGKGLRPNQDGGEIRAGAEANFDLVSLDGFHRDRAMKRGEWESGSR